MPVVCTERTRHMHSYIHTCTHKLTLCERQQPPSAHSFNNCQLYSCDKLFSHLRSCPTASTEMWEDNTDFWRHTDCFSVSLHIFTPLTKLWERFTFDSICFRWAQIQFGYVSNFSKSSKFNFPIWLDWYTLLIIGFLPILCFASGSTPGDILHSTALVKTQSRYHNLSICSYPIYNLSVITELVSMF